VSHDELNAFVNLATHYQCTRGLNYHALNDGSDEEDHIFKKLRLTSQSTIGSFSSHELILLEGSVSY
jgi:hypothetical protein